MGKLEIVRRGEVRAVRRAVIHRIDAESYFETAGGMMAQGVSEPDHARRDLIGVLSQEPSQQKRDSLQEAIKKEIVSRRAVEAKKFDYRGSNKTPLEKSDCCVRVNFSVEIVPLKEVRDQRYRGVEIDGPLVFPDYCQR
jgi:hypothetical protein